MTAPTPRQPPSLEALSEEIRRAAAEGPVEAVAALLKRRRSALDRAVADASTPETRSQLAGVLAALQALDVETERTLRRRLEDLGAALGAMEVGRRGLAGYASAGRSAGYWIDERG